MEVVSVVSVLDITIKSLLHDVALTISPDIKYSRHTKCIYCLSVQNWLCCVTSVSQGAGPTGLLGCRCYYHQSFCIVLLKAKQHFTSYLGVCCLAGFTPSLTSACSSFPSSRHMKLNLPRGRSLSLYFSNSPNFIITIL